MKGCSVKAACAQVRRNSIFVRNTSIFAMLMRSQQHQFPPITILKVHDLLYLDLTS
jgi:hypothetical protein